MAAGAAPSSRGLESPGEALDGLWYPSSRPRPVRGGRVPRPAGAGGLEETGHQANLPAQEAVSEEGARVSRPDVDPGGSARPQAAAPQGPAPADARPGAVRRRNRLRSSRDFAAVRAERRGAGDPLVRVQVRPRPEGNPRIGFAVSRRVGGAVARNRTRRRLRALCDRELPSMGPVDVVVIPTAAALPATFPELREALHRVLSRAGAL